MISLIVSILVGAFVGMVASALMDKESNGFILNAVLGLIGSAVGGWIGNLIGFGGGWISGILLAIVGSCLVIYVVGKLK